MKNVSERMYLKKIYFLFNYIIPVVFMAGIIFYFSAQPSLKSGLSVPWEIILRKGAHFLEYALLVVFLARLFFKGRHYSIRNTFLWAFLLSVGYACLDEFHQLFVVGRSGKLLDVGIDTVSILTALFFYLFYLTNFKVRKFLWRGLSWFIIYAIIVSTMFWRAIMFTESNSDVIIDDGDRNAKDNQVIEEGFLSNTTRTEEEKKNFSSDLSEKKSEKKLERKRSDRMSANAREEVSLPERVVWLVTFTTQSPFAKWDQLHEEACEEASLIMLKYHNDGKELTKQIAEKEIQQLVKYQLERYGDFYDTNIQATKEIGENFYHLNNLKIIQDFTIGDLKKELVQGNIILIPTAGRELHNPNFTPPGPLYHNLVIIGYDDTAIKDSAGRKVDGVFITNDPGTRRGKNYKYDQKVLYQAIHDFPGDVNKILTGEKRAIVLVH